MRTVLDAAVAVHIVMRTEKVAGFISRLEEERGLVLAPALFHGEVTNTL